MNKKNLYLTIGGGLVLLALMASLYLVRQNQNMNKSASGGNTGLFLSPDTFNKKVGEEFTVQVMANSGGKGVDTIKTKICFNKNNVGLANINPTSNITLNNNVFDNLDAKVVEEGENKCLIVNALNTSTVSTSQGEIFKLFDIKFKALAVSYKGSIWIETSNANTEMWGLDSVGNKYPIYIGMANGAQYTITVDDIVGTKIYLSPSSVSKNVNDEFTSELKVDSDKPVNSMRFYFCYKSDLLKLVDETAIKNSFVVDNAMFDNVIPGTKITEGENACFDVLFSKITGQVNTATGTIKIADIKLKALKAGSGSININKDKCEIGSQTIGSVAGQAYTINTATNNPPSCTPQCSGKCGGSDGCNGTCPNMCNSIQTCTNNVCVAKTTSTNNLILKFKMAFMGVKPGAQCAGAYDIKMIVMKGIGETSYAVRMIQGNNPDIVADGTNTNKFGDQIFIAKTPVLFDFPYTDQLSLFIKGNRHLQMKYGQDGQSGDYKKAIGAISTTRNESTAPLLDFSDYPYLAGDINQDDVINGVDYSILKSSLTQVGSPGNYQSADLNGDCVVNSLDTVVFKNSLVEKQGQLY